MNSDQFKGMWKEFKGAARTKWGKLTDDDMLQIKGDYQKFMGIVQKRYGDQKEDVTKWADRWLDDHQTAAKAR